MKKFTLLITAFAAFTTSYGQFSRSFNYQVNPPSAQSNFLHPEGNGDISAFTAYADGNQIRVKRTSFHPDGTLYASSTAAVNPSISFAAGLKISGVFEDGTTRVISFTMNPTASTQRLMWASFDIASGLVTDVLDDTTVYRLGFVHPVLNGSDVVSYQTTSSGLYRVSVPWNLSAINRELVTGAITTGTSTGSYQNCADAGTIFVDGTTETVYYTGGHSVVTFYQRTASGTYTTTTTTEPAPNAAEIVRTSTGNYVVLSKTKRQLYSSGLALIDSRPNSATSTTTAKTYAANGRITIAYPVSGSASVIKHVDESLNLIDSVYIQNLPAIADILPINGAETCFGIFGSTGYTYSYDGNTTSQNPSYIFHGQPVDFHALEEFRHRFQTDNLEATLGLGQQTLNTTYDSYASVVFHDSISVVYTAKDGVAGISSAGSGLGYIINYYYQSEELPGPWTNQADYNEVIEARYNRGFYVTKQMVEAHIDSLQYGSSGYIAPREIAEWPAHGNAAIGQAEDLAPFVDVNNNGMYEPYQGDYPKIYGSRCFFSITHSNPAIPDNAGIETHSFVYTGDCDASADFSDVILRKVFYYPRTSASDSLAIMPFTDSDIGGFNDDYAGTDVSVASLYTYQGDSYDENSNGRVGFKDVAAAFAQMQLKGAKAPDDTTDNLPGIYLNDVPNGLGYGDGVIDNEYFTMRASFIETSSSASAVLATSPGSGTGLINPAHDLYNLGDHPLYSTTSIPSRIAYPGDTDTLNYGTYGVNPPFANWSEIEPTGSGSVSNPAGDRRTLMTTGISKAQLNQPIQMDQAFVFVADSSGLNNTPGGIVPVLHDKCLAIRNAYQTGAGDCSSVFEPIEEDLKVPTLPQLNLRVYPNPTSDMLTIAGLPSSSQIAVYDLNGRQVWSGSENAEIVQFSVAQLPGSVFILKVTTPEGIYQARIVKK